MCDSKYLSCIKYFISKNDIIASPSKCFQLDLSKLFSTQIYI